MIGHVINIIIAFEMPNMPKPGSLPLVALVKHTMARTYNHWMGGTEDEQFKAAVALVLLNLEEGTPDYERVLAEMNSLNQLNAMLGATQAGLSISQGDLENLTENAKKAEPVGLIKLWVETMEACK